MPQWLRDLWQFLMNQKDPTETLLKILGLLFGSGALVALLSSLYSFVMRWWRARQPTESKAFEIFTDPAILLPRLYNEENDPDPLAHHRIPYRRRLPDRDLQGELRDALNTTTRYLLLTAPTGYGKTREAATLALSLMHDGYRVVRILKSPWLDVPKEFPPQLKDDSRRILILLDGLDGLFRLGPLTLSPRAEEGPMPGWPSVHDRLLRVLDYFERACGEREICVLATARDEESRWQVLNFDPRDALWKRFTRVKLPPPRNSVIVELLEEAVARADLPAEQTEFETIARRNDRTFMNVVVNLRRLRSENKPLTQDNYTPTLYGSWRQVYVRACKYPAVSYIYDAVSVLQQARIELYPWLVEPAARILWSGNPLQRLLHRRAVHRALRYLVNERILPVETEAGDETLQPCEGQIEAKGTLPDWEPHAPDLHRLVLRLADRKRTAMLESLLGFGATLYKAKRIERAAALWQRGTELAPQAAVLWSNLGAAFAELQRPAEAEAAYRQAIERDPNLAPAYSNLGNLLAKLERPAEALPLFQKSYALKPRLAPLLNLAGIYRQLGDAAATTKYAAETRSLIPADDWYNLACLESICGNTDASLEHLRRAARAEDFDPAWAWQDPDLEWIRDDPRFAEIVPTPPSRTSSGEGSAPFEGGEVEEG